ncbi:MAG: ankyrin repeat domain-containing protein [Gammaproteobacteria bacterium]|nr:ankyrin repeat domain-containing protein [Gammaproteobacteria bacterium]
MSIKALLTNKLIEAVINNDVITVRDLLEQGADPNHTLDAAQITPLHYAAQNDTLEVVPILIEAGAEVDAQTEPDGQTPVEVAFLHGNERIAKTLLAYSLLDHESIN